MIDTIGGGIKKMFETQRDRFFPLPDYDLQPEQVIVKIQGQILNERYTQLLIKNKDLDLSTVILLDKVQKSIHLSKEEHKFLKNKRLVEGRYPNLFVASDITTTAEERAKYIRYRAFDNKHYKEWILDFIKKFGSASRTDIDNLLIEKLPDVLSLEQKHNKIGNLLYAMAKKDKTISNAGSHRKPKWILLQNT
jgi:ATP-dependent DNA helicase RecG